MGSHAMLAEPEMQRLFEITNPVAVLLMHQDRMLDGWGWKPGSNKTYNPALDKRILKEIFPEVTWYQA
jgi:hypothetical protein